MICLAWSGPIAQQPRQTSASARATRQYVRGGDNEGKLLAPTPRPYPHVYLARHTNHARTVNDLFQLGETLTALEAGKVIVYPTDTVWGMGCDATDAAAVARVIAFKQREAGEGLVTLVDSIDMLLRYVDYVHPRLQTLLEHHQRPLTMIYEGVSELAAGVLAADGTAAIRVASDVFCRELIGSFGRPLVATSANRHGEPHPTHFGAITSDVLRAADHVVRYRQREKADPEAAPSVIARWNAQNEIQPVRH